LRFNALNIIKPNYSQGKVMKKITFCSSFVLAALLSGCQMTAETIAVQEQKSQVKASQFTKSEEKIQGFQTRLKQAHQDNLSYYAPEQLKNAIENYEDAQGYFDAILIDRSNATVSQTADILESLYQADTQLDGAYQTKQNVVTIMAESFDILSQLKSLSAATILPKQYRSLSADIDDIVEDISDGDLEDARADNAQLLPELRAFEVRIVKLSELKIVRLKAAQLKKAKALRSVPVTYQQALSAVANANSTISSDPRNKDNIDKVVFKAIFQLDRAANMLQSVKALAARKRSNREAYLLAYEAQLFNITKELTDIDLRNIPLKQQANELIGLAQAQKTKLSDIESRMSGLQQSAADGDQKVVAMIESLNQQKLALVAQLGEKEQELEDQKKIDLSTQQTIEMLNATIAQLQQQDLVKERQLINFEKKNLSLERKLIKLQSSSSALTQVVPAALPKPPVEKVLEAPVVEAIIAPVVEKVLEAPVVEAIIAPVVEKVLEAPVVEAIIAPVVEKALEAPVVESIIAPVESTGTTSVSDKK